MYCNCLLTRLLTSHFFIYDQVKKKVMMKVHIFWEWKELLRWKKSILHHFYGAFNEAKNEIFFGRWESDFKENIQPHSTPNPTPTFPIPPDQILLRLWNKTFLREIYRNMQTFAFKVLQSLWVKKCAVQMFFLAPNRNIFGQKFVNWERLLAVSWEHTIVNVKWDELRNMSEVFWANLYCKISSHFC